MPAVTIRNLSEETHRALKCRAKERGRSTEAEIRSILDDAVKPPEGQVGIGTALRNWALEYLHGEELVIEGIGGLRARRCLSSDSSGYQYS